MKNEHLDREAMDRYLAGEGGAVAEQHLAECAACRQEVEQVELALSGFRDSARLWSRTHRPVEWMPSHRPAPRRLMPLRWAATATAAIVLVGIPLYRNYSKRRAEAQAKADAVLLEEIGADISRPAPEPLEPLIKLVSQ